MNAQQLAMKLAATKTSNGWMAKCPAHADDTASLAIARGDDGKVLLKCMAGCEFSDIVSASGFAPSDFFTTPNNLQRPVIEAAYSYRDERGALLYQALRMMPKSFRQRAPEGSGWRWSTKGVRRVIYRLPELKKLKLGTVVFVVEGEKDVERLESIGLAATTKAGGAKAKWPVDVAEQLKGFRVVIIPDNDEAGAQAARDTLSVLSSLHHRPAILELPDLPPKGDVSDWLDNGGTKQRLMELARNAMDSDSHHKENEEGFLSSSERFDAADEKRIENIARKIPFNISYLDDQMKGIVPTDVIVIMASTGAGKTTLGSILAQKAAEDGRRVRFFALEAFDNEIELRMLYRELCTLANQAGVWRPWMTQQEWFKCGIKQLDSFVAPAKANLKKRLKTLETYYRGTKFDRTDVEREFMQCKGKADLIILDHLHYIDSAGPNENQELKRAISAIRDCNKALEIPVIVIAHIRKALGGPKDRTMIPHIDDLHGSSDVAKMATGIVAVAPAREEEFVSAEPNIANTFMAVLKDRTGGTTGHCALMRYDLGGMQYRHKYRVCRMNSKGKVTYAEKRPSWASNAMGIEMRA